MSHAVLRSPRWGTLTAARARPETGRMSRTEEARAAHLQGLLLLGKIQGWYYEPFRLRLGNDWTTSYTPDFLVVGPAGEMTLEEVKPVKKSGTRYIPYWTEDSRVKARAAARLYPIFAFLVAWKLPAKAGGQWMEEGL